MATSVTLVKRFRDPDYYQKKNSPTYSYLGGGGGTPPSSGNVFMDSFTQAAGQLTYWSSLGGYVLGSDGLKWDGSSLNLSADNGRILTLTRPTSNGTGFIIQNADTGAGNHGLLFAINDAEAGLIWNYENTDFIIGTNNTERLRILADGKVGIGTDTPSEPLHIEFSEPAGNLVGLRIKNINTNPNGSYAGITTEAENGTVISDWFSVPTNGSLLTGGGMGFRTRGAYPIIFMTNSIERVRIGSSGNFIIPATNKLYLDGGGDTYFAETAADTYELLVGGRSVLKLTPSTFAIGYNSQGPSFYMDQTGNTLSIKNVAGGYGFQFSSNVNTLTSVGGTARDFNIADAGGIFFKAEAATQALLTMYRNVYITGDLWAGIATGTQKIHASSTSDGPKMLAQTYDSATGKYTGLLFKVSANDQDLYKKAGLLFERTGTAVGKLHLVNDIVADTGNALLTDAKLTIGANGYLGVGTTSPIYLAHFYGAHATTQFRLQSAGGAGDVANLFMWASEPGRTYSGVGIANNMINDGGAPTYFDRYDTDQGGSYIRLLENQMEFENVTDAGVHNPVFKFVGGNIESLDTSYVSGFAGAGYRLARTGTGGSANYGLELDYLNVRKTFTVYELLVSQIRATNGSLWISDAAVIDSVAVGVGNDYDISFDTDGGNLPHPFGVDDLLRCQKWTGRSVKYYVVEVVSFTAGLIKVDIVDGIDIPEAGDGLVRMGNTSTAARQNAIYLTANDTNNPYIDVLAGVNSGTAPLGNFTKVRLGNLTGITDPLYGALSGYGLWSENVYLTGAIKATSGEIGGWTIDTDEIRKLPDANTYLRIVSTQDTNKPKGYQFYRANAGLSVGDTKIVQIGQLYVAGDSIITGTDYGFQIKQYAAATPTYADLVYFGGDKNEIAGWTITPSRIWKQAFTGSSFDHIGMFIEGSTGEILQGFSVVMGSYSQTEGQVRHAALGRLHVKDSYNTGSSEFGFEIISRGSGGVIKHLVRIGGAEAFFCGWTIDWDAIYTGTKKVTDGFTASGVTLDAAGAIRGPYFYINADGDSAFRQIEDATFKTDGDSRGIKISGGHIWENEENADDSYISINLKGYAGGTTKYRRTSIGDGKGSSMWQIRPDQGVGGLVEPQVTLKPQGGYALDVFDYGASSGTLLAHYTAAITKSTNRTVYLATTGYDDGQMFMIKRGGSGTCTVNANGKNIHTTAGDQTSVVLGTGQSLIVIWDSTDDKWYALGPL